MGLRGPAPKSTKLRILEGVPGHRPLNENEPEPESGAVCPDWMSDDAKEQWDYFAPVLEQCGILTTADQLTLAQYCDAAANWIKATKKVATLDNLSTSMGGRQAKLAGPVMVQRNYADLMLKFGTKLGLSPSDRTGIKATPKPRASKWNGKVIS